jgi:hypothetical protein
VAGAHVAAAGNEHSKWTGHGATLSYACAEIADF